MKKQDEEKEKIKQESLIKQYSRKMDLYNKMMQMQKQNQNKRKRYYNYESDSSNYEDNEDMTDYVYERPRKKSTKKSHTEKIYVDDEDNYVDEEEDGNDGNESEESESDNKPKKRKKKRNNKLYKTVNIVNLSI